MGRRAVRLRVIHYSGTTIPIHSISLCVVRLWLSAQSVFFTGLLSAIWPSTASADLYAGIPTLQAVAWRESISAFLRLLSPLKVCRLAIDLPQAKSEPRRDWQRLEVNGLRLLSSPLLPRIIRHAVPISPPICAMHHNNRILVIFCRVRTSVLVE